MASLEERVSRLESSQENLVSKADLSEMKAEVKAELAKSKVEIIKWVVGVGIGVGVGVVTLNSAITPRCPADYAELGGAGASKTGYNCPSPQGRGFADGISGGTGQPAGRRPRASGYQSRLGQHESRNHQVGSWNWTWGRSAEQFHHPYRPAVDELSGTLASQSKPGTWT